MIDKDLAARRYLSHVLSVLNVTPGRLARLAGISPSTLTRFINNPGHKFNISITTLEKIASASKISFSNFFDDGIVKQSIEFNEFERETVFSGATDPKKEIVVIGEIEAGSWRESYVFNISERLPIVFSNWDYGDIFSLLVADLSVNLFANFDDYLVCARFDEYLKSNQPNNSTLLIVERLSSDGQLREITARQLIIRENDFSLFFPSDDERYKQVLTFSDLTNPPGLNIIGVVLWIMKKLA